MLYQTGRKIIVGIVGVTVVLIGIALIVLPGPAFIVIPAGLAILGTEFLWAKRLLKKGQSAAKSVIAKARGFPVQEVSPTHEEYSNRQTQEAGQSPRATPPRDDHAA